MDIRDACETILSSSALRALLNSSIFPFQDSLSLESIKNHYCTYVGVSQLNKIIGGGGPEGKLD